VEPPAIETSVAEPSEPEPSEPEPSEPEPASEPPLNQVRPAISGTVRVAAVLTATPGTWSGEPALTYQWLANGVPIAGATGTTLTLAPLHRGVTISVAVTGSKDGHDPASAISDATAPVALGILRIATPGISGSIASGSTLTAKPGSWTPGTRFAYQWYANGKAIGGATKAAYKPTASHVGKRISVRVTGTNAGYATASRTSALSPKVAKAPTPLISGVRQAGKTLIVKTGSWTKGTRLSYQWLADGKPIAKATRSGLKLTKALAAKTITVRVTGRKAGYATVARTAAALGKWSGRWIEIDLSKQRLYLHQDGKVISSHLVSTGKRATPTELGTYRVRAKVRLQNMGCSPRFDYCTKNVPWVMFFNGDQAIHGAYWHRSFGRVMSHGCVNLPVPVSKNVYAWASVGTVVWVHP
jgi:lipoprotein-anchoring transpeptidase ErfK/SrfK